MWWSVSCSGDLTPRLRLRHWAPRGCIAAFRVRLTPAIPRSGVRWGARDLGTLEAKAGAYLVWDPGILHYQLVLSQQWCNQNFRLQLVLRYLLTPAISDSSQIVLKTEHSQSQRSQIVTLQKTPLILLQVCMVCSSLSSLTFTPLLSQFDWCKAGLVYVSSSPRRKPHVISGSLVLGYSLGSPFL